MTYLRVLVGSFLPFLSQCSWRRLGKKTDNAENNERGSDKLRGLEEYSPTLTLWRRRTRTMRTKRNPVRYKQKGRKKEIRPVSKELDSKNPKTPTLPEAAKNGNEKKEKQTHTGLLLVKSQLMPVNLHTVPQLHPQLSLFLRRHGLPALLDAGKGRIRNGMFGDGASLLAGDRLLLNLRSRTDAEGRGQRRRGSAIGTNGDGRATSSGSRDRAKEHNGEETVVLRSARPIGLEARLHETKNVEYPTMLYSTDN